MRSPHQSDRLVCRGNSCTRSRRRTARRCRRRAWVPGWQRALRGHEVPRSGGPVRSRTACVVWRTSCARLDEWWRRHFAADAEFGAQRSVRFSQDGASSVPTASATSPRTGRCGWALRGATASAPKAASSLPRFTEDAPRGTDVTLGGPSVEVVPLGKGASMTPELDSYGKAAKGPDAGADSAKSRARKQAKPKSRAAAAEAGERPELRHPRAPCVVPALGLPARARRRPRLLALPRPSVDPHRNHLAVHVEDHPSTTRASR